jgi:hypothetical protein
MDPGVWSYRGDSVLWTFFYILYILSLTILCVFCFIILNLHI